MVSCCNTTLPPLAGANKIFLFSSSQKYFSNPAFSINMKYSLFVFSFLVLVFASSCNKCYECKQYCAYCEASNGVRYKVCSTKGVNQFSVDSTLNAFRSAGYTCNLLQDDRNVCDQSSKINDAVNYYYKQDYYCNPKE